MVAYHPGKAANIEAAATMSQTSLPSHSGPMESSASCRSSSVCPTTACSMPTPKSKPSSTKNPVQNKATSTNQKIDKPIAGSLSVGHRPDPVLAAAAGRDGFDGFQPPSGVPDHQPPGDHGEHRVEQEEGEDARRHHGRV